MEKQITMTIEEAKSFLGQNESIDNFIYRHFPELKVKPLPKSWEELEEINGFWINQNSLIPKAFKEDPLKHNSNIFHTEKQAKSALAMAQLSQLMAVYNGDWVADWKDASQKKYTIDRCENNIEKNYHTVYYKFLSFKSAEIRNEFLKNFESLIREYLEL